MKQMRQTETETNVTNKRKLNVLKVYFITKPNYIQYLYQGQIF